MLLVYQVGTVKIGEVVRYTVTYSPAQDRILPSPERLYLRIRNTSAVALRAAFVHGPYTLSVAAYPATFKPNQRFRQARRYGVPEFEPMLKAGGSWQCELLVPDEIRRGAGTGGPPGEARFGGAGPERDGESVSWIVEVASQVIFSTSAAVGYEVVLARDEKSLSLGYALPVMGSLAAQAPQPGRVSDHQQSAGARRDHPAQARGVFSRAVMLKVEDTAALWNTPRLPGWDGAEGGGAARAKRHGGGADAAVESAKRPASGEARRKEDEEMERSVKKPKKVHLVVLIHGLHSNLGADMLFLKESIDAGVRQAKIDAKARRARERQAKAKASKEGSPRSGSVTEGGGKRQQQPVAVETEEDEDDDEEVIVRGYSGNATRTEKGIKYLGKRVARYVLNMTYPDQPYLPTPAKGAAEAVVHALKGGDGAEDASRAAHKHSTIHKEPLDPSSSSPHSSAAGQPDVKKRPYRITKISFIGHSLGGLVQTYAVAYIQKHSPEFFDLIEPVNFIALATPFLGLSNENPLYVRFALDFGLVGRTGQDLGLTWRAPTLARSGWGALVNLGESAHKRVLGDPQPESKPLLRILPTGPAHTALKKFRNRTVYSNVVNDGIVPLRTSCLLFLDWQGLGRVEKARRDAGLVETIVGAGWAELMGTSLASPRPRGVLPEDSYVGSDGAPTPRSPPPSTTSDRGKDKTNGQKKEDDSNKQGHDDHEVPQPSSNAMIEDDRQSLRSMATPPAKDERSSEASHNDHHQDTINTGPFSGFFSLFRSSEPHAPKSPPLSSKDNKMFRRSQTLKLEAVAAAEGKEATGSSTGVSTPSQKSRVTSGSELGDDDEGSGSGVTGGGASGTAGDTGGFMAPPRTTFFESASDLINPKQPGIDFLLDPSKRPRTIFHDRVYHPWDMPPPPLKKRPAGSLPVRRKGSMRVTPTTGTGLSQASNASSAYSSPSPPAGHHSPRHEDSLASTKDYDDTVHTNPDKEADEVVDGSSMRVEEKIARAYHRDLSWRKVLVKLEPDAHNNIIVRRMFANAFGWPVVKHLVDAHFSDSVEARIANELEAGVERALSVDQPPDEHGAETRGGAEEEEGGGGGGGGEKDREGRQSKTQVGEEQEETAGEGGESRDTVSELPSSPSGNSSGGGGGADAKRFGTDGTAGGSGSGSASSPPRITRPALHTRHDSVAWSDRDWDDTDNESDLGAAAADAGHTHHRLSNSGPATPIDEGRTLGANSGSRTPDGRKVSGGGGGGSLISGWNWAEKIVGRASAGVRSASKSPGPEGRALPAAGEKDKDV